MLNGEMKKNKTVYYERRPCYIYIRYNWFNKCIWLMYIIVFENKDAYVHYIF